MCHSFPSGTRVRRLRRFNNGWFPAYDRDWQIGKAWTPTAAAIDWFLEAVNEQAVCKPAAGRQMKAEAPSSRAGSAEFRALLLRTCGLNTEDLDRCARWAACKEEIGAAGDEQSDDG